MGQQQLLLIVLSTIIVGVSIVVGINMFGQGAQSANQDAVIQDIMTVGSRAQEWFRKPAVMGGGGRTFATMTLDTLNWPVNNENASGYVISAAGAASFVITGTARETGNTILATVFADSIVGLTIN